MLRRLAHGVPYTMTYRFATFARRSRSSTIIAATRRATRLRAAPSARLPIQTYPSVIVLSVCALACWRRIRNSTNVEQRRTLPSALCAIAHTTTPLLRAITTSSVSASYCLCLPAVSPHASCLAFYCCSMRRFCGLSRSASTVLAAAAIRQTNARDNRIS